VWHSISGIAKPVFVCYTFNCPPLRSLISLIRGTLISPEAMVALLCALSSLESLSLHFRSPQSPLRYLTPSRVSLTLALLPSRTILCIGYIRYPVDTEVRTRRSSVISLSLHLNDQEAKERHEWDQVLISTRRLSLPKPETRQKWIFYFAPGCR
jgi:hypothetical protein